MINDDTSDLTHNELLAKDDVPDANQSLSCFACNEPMTGLFCHACGNKNDDYRRSIWTLAADMFASITALEGRMWRSLRSLTFKPGEMAREYADGARTKWTSPVRLYLAMSLILFGYIAGTQTQLVALGGIQTIPQSGTDVSEPQFSAPSVFFLERKKKIQALADEGAIADFENQVAALLSDDDSKTIYELKQEMADAEEAATNFKNRLNQNEPIIGRSGIERALRSIEGRITVLEQLIETRENTPVDATVEDTDDTEIKASDSNVTFELSLGGTETVELGPSQSRDLVGIVLRNPERLNAPLNTHLPRIMFLMMPLSMLLGAIFIRGRDKAMLYDHLVHAAYIHAFSFLLLLVFILLTQFTSIPGLLFVYTVILIIYLPLSAKRMFERSWPKTIFASYSVGIIYTLVMAFILLSLISFGILGVARDVA